MKLIQKISTGFFLCLFMLLSGTIPASGGIVVSAVPGFLPNWAAEEFMGVAYWQIGGLILIMLAAWILSLIMDKIIAFILNRIISRFRFYKLVKKYIVPISKPAVNLIVTVIVIFIVPMLELPTVFGGIVMQVLDAMIPLFLTIAVFRMSDLIGDFMEKAASKTKSTVDDNMVPLARKAIKIVTVILGGIYILHSFGISVAPLLAGVSIGGLAFALAAQDTIKNLFGSFTIFTDQPFQVGDWIVFDGTEGTVIEVGVRSTRVKTFWDSVISIPNGRLADIRIDNMGRRDYRRFSTNIGVTYDTDPDAIDAFVRKLKVIANEHPKVDNENYQIHLNSFGEKSINILFYIFFKTVDWTKELEARHEVMLSVIRAAKELDIRLAYPIRDYSKEPPQ
ncbi:MAG: mechanosensitive ion channel family protein [Chlorobi bacterium]|nr:mechanosensitive ion channel family protein [Chlorobiota bacterium]